MRSGFAERESSAWLAQQSTEHADGAWHALNDIGEMLADHEPPDPHEPMLYAARAIGNALLAIHYELAVARRQAQEAAQ